MSAWSGDIGALGRLAQNIGRLASVPSRASVDASRGIARQIDQQFARGVDPYGKAWKRLAPSTIAKGRRPPPMTDTGDLRNGADVRPRSGAGIDVTFSVPYLGFHQGAGSPRANVPPRHVLPEGPLPPAWEKVIAQSVDNAFTDAFTGRR